TSRLGSTGVSGSPCAASPWGIAPSAACMAAAGSAKREERVKPRGSKFPSTAHCESLGVVWRVRYIDRSNSDAGDCAQWYIYFWLLRHVSYSALVCSLGG